MKYYIKFSFLLFFTLYSFVLLSQTVVVQYESYRNGNPDFTNKFKDMPENIKAKAIKNAMTKYKDHFTLKYSNGKSSYIYNRRVFESEPDFKPISFLLNHYNDYDKKKIVLIADWIPSDYQVTRDFDEIKIKLLEDTLTINGFLCKKAEVEFMKDRKATVWYTPEIPVMAGPTWFFGLPGLVLKVEIMSFVTEATKIEFKDMPIEINIPNRKNSITYKEYRKGKNIEWISNYNK